MSRTTFMRGRGCRCLAQPSFRGSQRTGGVPCTTFMHDKGDTPRTAQPSCKGREIPRTAFMQGQGDTMHNLQAGASGRPAPASGRGGRRPPVQLSCLGRGMGMPRPTFRPGGMGNAPHSLHVGAGGCPAQPSCRGRGMPRTAFRPGGMGMPRIAFMQGQVHAPHNFCMVHTRVGKYLEHGLEYGG